VLRGVSGTYGLFSVTQTIYVSVAVETVHARLSNRIVAVFELKFSPVKVTVVAPSTEPNLGVIAVSLGVLAAEYLIVSRGTEVANSSVPRKILGEQVYSAF